MANITTYKRKETKKTNWVYDVKINGMRKRKGGFNTKKEALYAGQQLIKELENDSFIDKNKLFNVYFAEWVSAHPKVNLSPAQKKWYDRSYNEFNLYFGDIKLKHISRNSYQAFLNKYGDGRTAATVRKLHGIVSQILRDAAYDGYIKKDPTYKIKISGTVKSKKEEDKYIKIQEYLDLLEYFKSRDEKSYIFLFILAVTGARYGEVDNLTKEDLLKGPGIIHLPGTKTDNADRDVEVNQNDIDLILEKLSKHQERSDGFLFKISHNGIKRSMNYAKKHVGMESKTNVTLYALRHTHCSYLISKGIPIEYISKRLGHSKISITLNFYAHLLDEHREKQGNKVREIFS